jgi:hypothetical protein
MGKARYYVRPSSIASYFGVGWNEPSEQLSYDMGLEEQEFGEEAENRMALGKHLEDAALNYFEEIFETTITDRNSELIELYDGKIHGKYDGIMEYEGKRILVENKISNAQSYKFTETPNYLFQVQTYLIDPQFDCALLCGLWKGKPIYTWVERDEEVIEDIKTMVDFITECLAGLNDFSNFPEHLYEKYSNKKMPVELTDIDKDVVDYWETLAKLNAEEADIKRRIKELKKAHEEHENMDFCNGVFENDNVRVKISTFTRKGSIDYDKISLEYPYINFEKYREPEKIVTMKRFKYKK